MTPIVLGQVFGLACGVVGIRVTSSVVPPEVFGPYAVFLTFAPVGMWAVHAGVVAFTGRFWAGTSDHRALSGRIADAAAGKLPWLLLACAIGAVAARGIPPWVQFPLLVLSAISLSAATLAQSALQALRKHWHDTGISAVASVSRSFLPPLLFLAAGQQVIALYAGFTAHALMFAAAGIWALRATEVRRPNGDATTPPLPPIYTGSFFIILATANWVLLSLGRWMMALFYGPNETAYFAIASSLAALIPSVIGTMCLMYFQPEFFAAPLGNPAARNALARRVDRVALGHAVATLGGLAVLHLLAPRLIGRVIDPAYAPVIGFLLPAGCFALAITTGQFYRSLLMAGKQEAGCGPAELTAAAVLVVGSFVSALAGQAWFLRWMMLSPVVPWIVNRPLARRQFQVAAASSLPSG